MMAGNNFESPVRLAAETWESLFRAQVAVMRKLQAGPAFRKLAVNEYDVLFTLARCPTGWLRLNELNDNVLLSQSSLSRLVERLEKRGLVARMAGSGGRPGRTAAAHRRGPGAAKGDRPRTYPGHLHLDGSGPDT
jgi:hypothetical protein